VAIQEDMSAQLDLCSHDIDKFRSRTNKLLTWGYALLIVGLLALAAGYFHFIIVFAHTCLWNIYGESLRSIAQHH
jgi:hypothetical protein